MNDAITMMRQQQQWVNDNLVAPMNNQNM
jgi:hypothetical protein